MEEALTSQIEALRRRHDRRQIRILAGCIVGSLAVHLAGWAWIASMREPERRAVPSGYMEVEQWPAPPPPAPPVPVARAGSPERAPPAGGGGAPARQVPRVVRATAPVNAGESQRKGILRALAAAGKGPIARGLPGTLAAAEAPSGEPEATGRASASPPARRGGDAAAPAAAPGPGTGLGGFGAGVGTGTGTGGGTGAGVLLGTGTVDSAEIDRARLDAFVKARIGGLRACYEMELRLDPNREGTVRVRFVIRATGELSDVVVARDVLESATMADCLARILRTWTTPFRPSRAVPVEIPFVFRSSRR